MIRIFLCFFCLFSFSSLAAPPRSFDVESYSFDFDFIKLTDLARLVFSDVLGQSFILDTDFLKDKQAVGFNLRNASKAEVKIAFDSLLFRHGFRFVDGKILLVLRKEEEKPEKEESEFFYYKPKFRSVSYITDMVSALFEKGRFSTQRQLKSPEFSPAVQSVAPMSGVQPGQQVAPVARPVQDSGTSVHSMIDKETDAFIFQGSAKEIEKLKKLLAQIDVSAGQILVRAHVFEVTTGAKEGSGFALALNLISYGAPNVPTELTKWAYKLGDLTKNLGNSVSVGNSTIEAVYSALSSDSRFRVVSSPSLRVKSGESARFSVGSDVPVLGAVQLDKNGNPVQSVEYKPSGVILDLKPKIRGEEIELTVNQQLSSFIATTTGVNNSPTLIKREIQTNVGVMDGDVIVLGGLDETRNSNDTSGLPFLPAILRSNGKEDSKTELLLVLETQKI